MTRYWQTLVAGVHVNRQYSAVQRDMFNVGVVNVFWEWIQVRKVVALKLLVIRHPKGLAKCIILFTLGKTCNSLDAGQGADDDSLLQS
jgi:hypothetical protein